MKLTQSIRRQEDKSKSNPFPPGQLYHLSEKPLPGIMRPRVPENYMTQQGYEDGETPRISVSNSVDGALRALSSNLKGKTLHVYVLETSAKVHKPTIDQVPDSKITEERWILGDAKPKLVGKIQIGDGYGDGHLYTFGDHSARLYDWNWTVVDTDKK